MREKSQEIIREITEGLISINPIVAEMIQGCNEAEILSIEAAYNLTLPIDYREFLGAFGKCNRTIFHGFDIAYPAPIELTKSIIFENIAFADEDYIPPQEIPYDIFIIGSCWNEDFWFILTEEKSEESAIYFTRVYQYNDNFEYTKCCNSIWEFMQNFATNLR